MTPLYTPELSRRCRLRARCGLIAAFVSVFAAWAACAFLCARVRTANAAAMFRLVMVLSVCSGWIAILFWRLLYRPARAEEKHVDSILTDPPEEYRGVLALETEAFQIPKGICVRRARLDTAEGPVSLRLDDRLSRRMPTGVPLRVLAVRQYITAYEVQHEDD